MATLLVITVFLPLLGGLALVLMPWLDRHRARTIALSVALATLALSLILLASFRPQVEDPQFTWVGRDGKYGISWSGNASETPTRPTARVTPGGATSATPVGSSSQAPERPDIRFALGLDGISLWLFVLTSLLMITAVCSSWESITERVAAHYAFLLALETGLLGLFASLDVVLFYIFFEFTLIPLFFLIGIWGGPQRRRASVMFFLYTLAGSLLTLLGVIALVVVHYQFSYGNVLTFSIPELTRGLSAVQWPAWHTATSWGSPQVLIFLLLLAGFAIKVPMFPVHTWLPLAHVEAPTAGSIVLAGVLLKVGSYGLLRFNLGMTPLGAAWLFPMLATLAVIGIIYGAFAALAQTDIKRLVAYSSVSHMGFVVLGLFALNPTGMDGSLIQMLNHGLTTGALFACVGVIYERYHTRAMDEMSGLWNRLPLLAFFLILAALGSAAVPGLNGFVGEFPILVGAFGTSPVAGVLAATGMILGAFYLLWMVRRVIFGPLWEPAENAHAHGPASTVMHDALHAAVRPVGWHEVVGLAPLMFLIVAIGVYPRPIFEQIQPAVHRISQNIQTQRERQGEIIKQQLERSQTPVAPARRGGTGKAARGGGATAKGKGQTKAQRKGQTKGQGKGQAPTSAPGKASQKGQ
jgi:NADH-quinone oxidoreductase subunit M